MARAILRGTPISPGIAIGRLLLSAETSCYEKRRISEDEIEAEIKALNMASEVVCESLRGTMQNMPENLSEYREIIAAQIELARDAKILDGATARIRRRKICAPWALAETVAELCSLFLDLPDQYLRDRAQDIKIIGKCLQNALGGYHKKDQSSHAGVLAAFDLSPAHVLELKLEGIEGLLTVEGGSTSHTAILARGLKVPGLVGVTDLFNVARDGETVIVDGLAGIAFFDPDHNDLAEYQCRRQNYMAFQQEAENTAYLPAKTRDGITISVCANVDKPDELPGLAKSGAEGIGLYRTEFSYLGDKLPDEEQLVREYRQAIDCMTPARVVFRTLDVGADKLIPLNETLYEPNPALGLRGIRFCLRHADIFMTQLRAILRAGHNANMAIMLPMVTTLDEVRQARHLLHVVQKQLSNQKIPCADKISLGVMVETPAAMLICEELAEICDFISIGTNDLLHYLMAIDRNNRHVAYLHEPLHPAFTRSLKHIIDSAHKKGIPVSVCGELASDPFGAAILLGLGVDTLSATPRFVPALKHMLRRLDAGVCKELAREALESTDENKLRKRAHKVLQKILGPQLSFHNTLILNEIAS